MGELESAAPEGLAAFKRPKHHRRRPVSYRRIIMPRKDKRAHWQRHSLAAFAGSPIR
jgi:hypothetical protein